MRQMVFIFVLSLVISATATGNDKLRRMNTGDRVKIEYDSTVTEKLLGIIPLYKKKEKRKLIGKIERVDNDSIIVRLDEGKQETRGFETGEVKRFYHSTGKRSAFPEGLGSGFLLGLLLSSAPSSKYPVHLHPTPEKRLAALGIMTMIGSAIGIFIEVDTWERLDKENISLGMAPAFREDMIGLELNLSL